MAGTDWPRIPHRLLQPSRRPELHLACNEKGDYEQTTDRDYLLSYFEITRLSKECDYYGVHKRRLGPLRKQSGD
jgi:hypothetical protein